MSEFRATLVLILLVGQIKQLTREKGAQVVEPALAFHLTRCLRTLRARLLRARRALVRVTLACLTLLGPLLRGHSREI